MVILVHHLEQKYEQDEDTNVKPGNGSVDHKKSSATQKLERRPFRRTFMMAHVITPRTATRRTTPALRKKRGSDTRPSLFRSVAARLPPPTLGEKNLPITKMAGTPKS